MIYFSLSHSPDNRFVITETTQAPSNDTILRTMNVFLEVLANTSLCVSVSPNFPTNPFLAETHLSVLTSMHAHLQTVVSKMKALQQQTLPLLQNKLQEIKTAMTSLSWNSFNTFIQAIPLSSSVESSDLSHSPLPILTIEDVLLQTNLSTSQPIALSPVSSIGLAQLPLSPVTPSLISSSFDDEKPISEKKSLKTTTSSRHQRSRKRKAPRKSSSSAKKAKLEEKTLATPSLSMKEKTILLQQKQLTEKVLETIAIHRENLLLCKQRLLHLQPKVKKITAKKEKQFSLTSSVLTKPIELLDLTTEDIVASDEEDIIPPKTPDLSSFSADPFSLSPLPSSPKLLVSDEEDLAPPKTPDLSSFSAAPFSPSSSHTSFNLLISEPADTSPDKKDPTITLDLPGSSAIKPKHISLPIFPVFSVQKHPSTASKINFQLIYTAKYNQNTMDLKHRLLKNIKISLSNIDFILKNPHLSFFGSCIIPFSSSNLKLNERSNILLFILVGLEKTLACHEESTSSSFLSFPLPNEVKTDIKLTIKKLKSELRQAPPPSWSIPDDVMEQAKKEKINMLRNPSAIQSIITRSTSLFSLPLFLIHQMGMKRTNAYKASYTCRHSHARGKLFQHYITYVEQTIKYAHAFILKFPRKLRCYDPLSLKKTSFKTLETALPSLLQGLQENLLFLKENNPELLKRPNKNPLKQQLNDIIDKLLSISQQYPSLQLTHQSLAKNSKILNKVLAKDLSTKKTGKKTLPCSKSITSLTSEGAVSITIPPFLPIFVIDKKSHKGLSALYKLSYRTHHHSFPSRRIKGINNTLLKTTEHLKTLKTSDWSTIKTTWIHPLTHTLNNMSSFKKALPMILQGLTSTLSYYTENPLIAPTKILLPETIMKLQEAIASIPKTTPRPPSAYLLDKNIMQKIIKKNIAAEADKN